MADLPCQLDILFSSGLLQAAKPAKRRNARCGRAAEIAKAGGNKGDESIA
jgi:hypothetical protein